MRHRLSLPRKIRLVLVVLLAVLVLQLSQKAGPPAAEAYDFVGAMSNVIPFAGFIRAFGTRNRVYREANSYINEQKDYYDRLQTKARELYVSRNLANESRSQTGAYTKVSVLIAQERKASLDFAESKKRAARAEFLDKFEKAIIARVLNSGAAQRLLKAMSAGLRAAQGRLDEALSHLAGEEGGFLGTLAKVRRQAARMHVLAGAIGGRGGGQIAKTMSKLVRTIDNTTGTFSQPISDVNADLDDLADMVESLESQNMVAMGATTPNDFVIRLVSADADDPVLDAILGILDQKSGRGDGTIREQARQKILTGFIIRCARMSAGFGDLLAKVEADIDSEGDVGDVSLCQAITDLLEEGKDLETAVQEAAAQEGTAEESADPYLKLLSVETKDGWCFPRNENLENTICEYTLEWQLEYLAQGPSVGLQCVRKGVDHYLSEIPTGKTFQQQSGVWAHSMTTGGFYPDLGDYDEFFYCDMFEGNLGGQFVTRVEAHIVAPLNTVREP